MPHDRPHHDHRDLGRELSIFTTDPRVGPGLPLWLPDGAAIRDELQRLAKELAREDGCVDVYSPVLAKRSLYARSGHLAKFADDMFPGMQQGAEEVMLRPANCPHHAVIYAAAPHSYRELPVRLNELGAMFRAERSGVVSGLSRVRQINLDDTHVFCRPDQVQQEAARALRTALRAQRILGLPVDDVRLSLRDDAGQWLGEPEQWRAGDLALRHAAREVDVEVVEAPGEAAFYGPKLDLQRRDEAGREETIATVQVDFSTPQRFDLSYRGSDGIDHPVVMIHRGIVGSMERVTAALLEHYRGRLPFWLAPRQLVVLPVSPLQDEPARSLVDGARAAGLRASFEPEGTLGARIRQARALRVGILAVIGAREVAGGMAQVTEVAAGKRVHLPVADLLHRMKEAHRDRAPTVIQ